MAIKIKKKGEETEGGETPALPPTVDASTYDSLHAKSYQFVDWLENNRGLAIGAVVALVVAVMGIHFAMQYVESQEIEASTRLSEGLAAYEVLVEGSPDLKALREDDRIAPPEKTFATEEEKWQAVYDGAAATLKDFDSGEIARSARLTKAAAAYQLGNFDEAIALYEEVLQGARGEVRDFAQIGLANALSSKGEHEKAIATFDKLAENPDQAAFAKYEKARILQRTGKAEDAKTLFHEILETYPATTFRDDIERRLAML
ncbi:MAG: tetratricopeptide repeat protein [Bradymonadaceae bacterium]